MIRALCLGLVASLLAQSLAAQELKPFIARYAWSYRGINAGQSTLTLTRRDDGRWIYSSRSVAHGIPR